MAFSRYLSIGSQEMNAAVSGAQPHSTASPAAHPPVPDSIPVISDERPASAAAAIGPCPLIQTQQQVESNLDSLLSELPEDAAAAEADDSLGYRIAGAR